jgi:hypothetical protein
MSTLYEGFPRPDDDLIEKIVDMEYITQSDYAWKEAPALAVLLAVETLKQPQPESVLAMARTTIYLYGNWKNKDLQIAPAIRQEMYRRNYGEDWEDFYHEDGF